MEEILIVELEKLFQQKFNTYVAYMKTVRTPTLALKDIQTCNILLGETVVVNEFPTIKIYSPNNSKRTDELMQSEADYQDFTYHFYIDIFVDGDTPKNTLLTLLRYKDCVKELMKQYSTLEGLAFGSIITDTQNTNLFRAGTNLHQGARLNLDVISYGTDPNCVVED